MGLGVRLILLILFVSFVTMASGADESALDRLPIGRSPQRLAIAVLEAGKTMDAAMGTESSMASLVRRYGERDVFIIGEYHDSWACHSWQKNFIEALAGEHPRLVVGFEFFHCDDDPVLQLYLEGKITEPELLKKTGWYARGALNFGYTRLVLETVKRLGLKAVGLNVPRELVHRVARKGFSSLSADEKAVFPGVERSHPEHRFYIQSIFGAFAAQVPLWFRNIYDAQKCWDAIMAGSMHRVLTRREFQGHKGVIIAGSAHVAYGLGIPWRYRTLDAEATLLTLMPVRVPVKKQEPLGEENPMVKALSGSLHPVALFSRGLADVVFAIAEKEKPYYVEAGFSGRMNADGMYEVERVAKGSPADKAGLKQGDIILSLDGIPVASLESLRLTLAQKNWTDEFILEIRKKMPLNGEKSSIENELP